jgi:hypothetical protein
LALYPFHWFHVGGGNCGVPLRFNFIGDTKHLRPLHRRSRTENAHVDTNFVGEIQGGREDNSFVFQFIKERAFLYENLTVDVISFT